MQQWHQLIRTPFPSSQLTQIRWPTSWFDNVFRPNIGIDVYNSGERISAGMDHYENDYAEILLIRYEDLDSALEPLRRFLGLLTFSAVLPGFRVRARMAPRDAYS